MKVIIVIPAYNEANTIASLLERALETGYPVIVVNDGSSDETAELAATFPVTLLNHETNSGKAAALISGFRAALSAGADAVLTLDGDGQHRPEDADRLIEKARRHPDSIIIGNRLHDHDAIPAARRRANKVANFWISWAAGHSIADSQSGFRLYPAPLLRHLSIPHGRERGFVFESEILIEAARKGTTTVSVPIPALYAGTLQRASHFRPVADITRIVLMVAGKLLSRGMYPTGLYRSLFPKHT